MTRYLLLFLLLLGLGACKPSKEKLSEQITAMENRLFSPDAQGLSQASVDSLIASYESYASRFPDDAGTPDYLFKAAGIAMNTGNGARAIELYDRLMAGYAAHPKAELALFFKGYVQENLMKNLEQAKETYLLFIEKFPDNEFADDARASIDNLGKTPEQMIREFEAKRMADSAAMAEKK